MFYNRLNTIAMSESTSQTENPQIENQSKPSGILIPYFLVFLILVLLIIIGSGYALYVNVIYPDQIAEGLNHNSQILKNNKTESKQIITAVNDKLNSLKVSDTAGREQYLALLETYKNDLSKGLNLSKNAVKLIQDGINEDASKHVNSSRDTLELTQTTFGKLNLAIDGKICLYRQTSGYTLKLDEAVKSVSGVDQTNKTLFTNAARSSANKIDEGASNIVALSDCFKHHLMPFLTENLKSSIANDNTLYKNLATKYRVLADAIEQKNVEGIDTTNNELAELIKQKYQLTDNADLQKAIDSVPLQFEKAEADIDSQTQSSETISRELKSKYRIKDK